MAHDEKPPEEPEAEPSSELISRRLRELAALADERREARERKDKEDECRKNRNAAAEEYNRFAQFLRNAIVGQDDAVEAVLDSYMMYLTGLVSPTRPVGSFLFLGPTGVGKTLVAEKTAEGLHGDPKCIIKIHCAEYQHSHEVAKLIGSPPGYLGHRETPARISIAALSASRSAGCPLNVLVFDEVEKAHAAISDTLLGVLDKGEMVTGENLTVNLRNTLIFMTSNVGSRDFNRSPLGFAGENRDIQQVGMSAVQSFFRPEFLSRLDHIVVFPALTPRQCAAVTDLEVDRLIDHVAHAGVKLNVTVEARRLILHRGMAAESGARGIRNVAERLLMKPLAQLILKHGRTVGTDFHARAAVRKGAIYFEFTH